MLVFGGPLCISNAEDKKAFNGGDGLSPLLCDKDRLYMSEERGSLSFKELFEAATIIFVEVAENGGEPRVT